MCCMHALYAVLTGLQQLMFAALCSVCAPPLRPSAPVGQPQSGLPPGHRAGACQSACAQLDACMAGAAVQGVCAGSTTGCTA